MSDSQTLEGGRLPASGCWLPASGCRFLAFRRLWPGITVCALCAGYAHILARFRNPLQGFCPLKEGGPWLFVTQHGRHKSKSRNADFIIIAPKGETTHYILRVASAPSKCVRCAPQGRYHNLRAAGPSNLRTLRTLSPLWCLRHHLPAPLGSVSLDSQSPTVPCESSSLATASGGTKNCREPSEPVGRRVPHPV